jgi:hypothetical protein
MLIPLAGMDLHDGDKRSSYQDRAKLCHAVERWS